MSGVIYKKEFNKKNLIADYWLRIISQISVSVYGKKVSNETEYIYVHYIFKSMFLTEELYSKILKKRFTYIKDIAHITNEEMYDYIKKIIRWSNKNLKTTLGIPKYENEKK